MSCDAASWSLAFVFVSGLVGHAQIVVYDRAVTFRNSVTAALKEYLLTVQRQQHSQLRRMAQRLSMFTDLGKYTLPDPPRWRTHALENHEVFLFSTAYHAALNYGDASGPPTWASASQCSTRAAALGRLHADRATRADSPAGDTGPRGRGRHRGDARHRQLRYNGRQELRAIEALDRDVTNGSLEQSTTAVLDKISGAVLIGARQRQARAQLLSGVVEQLLVDSKRARDTEAATMNMQLSPGATVRPPTPPSSPGPAMRFAAWRQP